MGRNKIKKLKVIKKFKLFEDLYQTTFHIPDGEEFIGVKSDDLTEVSKKIDIFVEKLKENLLDQVVEFDYKMCYSPFWMEDKFSYDGRTTDKIVDIYPKWHRDSRTKKTDDFTIIFLGTKKIPDERGDSQYQIKLGQNVIIKQRKIDFDADPFGEEDYNIEDY